MTGPPNEEEEPARAPLQNDHREAAFEGERIAIAKIITGIRGDLPPRRPTVWCEEERNRVELIAWLGGRRRICDLVA